MLANPHVMSRLVWTLPVEPEAWCGLCAFARLSRFPMELLVLINITDINIIDINIIDINIMDQLRSSGRNLTREYAVDPLEILFVHEVMRTKVAVLAAESTLAEIWPALRADHRQEQRLLPVVSPEGQLIGVPTRGEIGRWMEEDRDAALKRSLGSLVRPHAVEAYPDEPLRVVVYRIADKGFTLMPVVERSTRKLLGLLALNDLLKARTRHLEEEVRREKTLHLKFVSRAGRDASGTLMSTTARKRQCSRSSPHWCELFGEG
jgi:chloride channel protein, CIC family